ncbi:MAG: gamma-glutamyltransferase [Alphaproteobacteria bacterium]
MAITDILNKTPGPIVALAGTVTIGAGSILFASVLNVMLAPSASIGTQTVATEQTATQPDTVSEQSDSDAIAPEPPSQNAAVDDFDIDAIESDDYMIAAAHPAAAQAGALMLSKGGAAIDAAIAAQMVLNLVEPQSSGIGGGAFMLHWDKRKRRLETYDGRETAPKDIDVDFQLDSDGDTRDFYERIQGGESVGVPGVLAMLKLAHDRHGKLPWKTLFEPAIDLAQRGFPVSPRLNRLILDAPGLSDNPTARDYFFDSNGQPKPVGTVLRNPEFAKTLALIAEEGPVVFYEGEIARDIVNAVRGAAKNPGSMTRRDLALYTAKIRRNLCNPYRDYLVCGMPPPSSGGLTVLQTLGLLETVDDFDDLDPAGTAAIQRVAEASSLAFADRNRYIADPDFIDVPTQAMLNPAYLEARAEKMRLNTREKDSHSPGSPADREAALELTDGIDVSFPSTTHLSVIDSDGNALSMTSSIENGFGSRLMVRGFLLNNQLTDFNAVSTDENGEAVANRVEGGKRPRSSMAPTLVFDEDRDLLLAVGSPGGSRIIGYVTQALINMLDWDMNPQEAVSFPHYLSRNYGVDLEQDTPLEALAPDLVKRGYEVRLRHMTSGLHAVMVDDDELEGGIDPRREGAAIGEEQLMETIDDAFDFIAGQ